MIESPSLFSDVGVSWRGITRDEANAALISWGHKMGPMIRVDYGQEACTGLMHDGRLVAIACTSGLVRENVGGCPWATRETAVELSRLCAERPGLCRVALRLWREFTFPQFNRTWAISYQDADLHTGNTYRFDGWHRVAYSGGGLLSRPAHRAPRSEQVGVGVARAADRNWRSRAYWRRGVMA